MPDPLPAPHLAAVTAGREAVRAKLAHLFPGRLGINVADEVADAAMAPLIAGLAHHQSAFDAQLAAILAVVNAATPAPWHAVEATDADVSVIWSEGAQAKVLARVAADADGEFIARARTYVPVLLAEVHRLRTELARRDAAFEAVLAMDDDVNALFNLGQVARTYTHALITPED